MKIRKFAEPRNARGLSQKMLAEAPHTQQPAIAKLERRTASSPLRSHIKAVGGSREILTRLPDGTVKTANFSQVKN